ncbi:MAG: hypothetical protein RLZZ127_385 [Planctomycetota bacterium]|jgi:hypothetical protein
MRALPSVLVLGCLLAGCGQPERPSTGKMAPDIAAERTIEAVEARLARAKALPPAERRRDLADLEDDLLARTAEAEGSKAANHLWYYLAWWRLEFAPERGTGPVLEACDNLDRQPNLHLKQAGALVRIRALGRRGELQAMQAQADALAGRVPELGEIARRWTAFHRLAGATVGALPLRNLSGGADDLQGRSDPFQAWIFVGTYDPETEALVARFLAEVPAPVRPVVVCFDSSPLIAGRFAATPGSGRADLLWAAPDDQAAVAAAWRLPEWGATVLVGPGRRVLAVDLPPAVMQAAIDGRLVR